MIFINYILLKKDNHHIIKQSPGTFDNGPCNWTFDQSSWKAGKFSDMQNNYAPPRDHT